MTSNDNSQRPGLSRRTLIRATGTATVGALLGTTTTTGYGEVDQPTTFRTGMETPPQEVQFNPRNAQHRSPNVESLLFDPLAEYDPRTETFVPVLAEDWSFSAASDSLSITLREGYSWHEVTHDGQTVGGQAIDATDLQRQLLLDAEAGADYWDLVSGVSVPSSDTLRVDFDGPVNESVARFDLLTKRLSNPPTYFESGGSGYGSMRISPGAGDPPVGSGPFKFDSLTDAAVTLTTADSHPDADGIGVDSFVFEDLGSESEQWAALADEEISGSGAAYFPEKFRRYEGATPVESLTQLETPSDAGWGILINHRHPLLSDRRIRKAFAHVFSSADAVSSMTDTVPERIALQTGLSPAKTREYLDGHMGRFETYGDPKRAAELLGRAGFERTWEQWMDPRGEPATFGFLAGGNPHADDGECFAPTEPGWFYGARSFVHQLEAFLRWDNEDVPEYGAEMVQDFSGIGPHDDPFAFVPARQWGHFDGAHPYHNFRSDMLARESANLGYGPTVEVPPYDDPSAPTETVDVREKLDALRTATDEATERRLVRELAWVVNETVPYLQGYYRPSVGYVDERFWSFEDPATGTGTDNLVRTGDLQPTN